MFEKIKEYLEKDSTFIVLFGLATAGVIGGTSIFLEHGTGLFNEIYIGEMLNVGLETGDFSAPAAFAVGFLIARLLEGPLVGILDIGGSLMTGLGVGIPALLLSLGLDNLVTNFPIAIVVGLIIGLIIGIVLIAIRRTAPDLSLETATSIMMGAGNRAGEALGPMVLLSAISYSIPAGIGATIGSFLFYKYKKPMVGGAILGAIIVGALHLLLGGTLPEA